MEGKVDNITHLYFKYPKASLKWTFQIYRTLIIWKLDFLKFIFHWRIIALRHCVCFCHTTTWIRHKYVYIYIYPLLLEPPSHFILHPTPLDCHSAPCQAPFVIQQLSTSYLFYICTVYVSILFSQFVSPSSSHIVSTSLFSISAVLFLPC